MARLDTSPWNLLRESSTLEYRKIVFLNLLLYDMAETIEKEKR